jgi:hypothetical protein
MLRWTWLFLVYVERNFCLMSYSTPFLSRVKLGGFEVFRMESLAKYKYTLDDKFRCLRSVKVFYYEAVSVVSVSGIYTWTSRKISKW